MIHELDHAVRNCADTRPLRRLPSAPFSASLSAPLPSRLTASSTARPQRTEGARLWMRDTGRAMHPAAIRVLETTWRVWREPLA
jgi:hypothetical protein